MIELLIILPLTFGLLFVIFILPERRRQQAHQVLVAGLLEGDEVVLGSGIYGRIVELGPEDMQLEIAPGVVVRVARGAVLRCIENALPEAEAAEPADEPENDD